MRARVSDELCRRIENDIADGRLLPGDKLDEQSLAKRFSVSRTPAREALLRLANDGLVKFKSRQGAVVASMTPQRAIGMVEILTALEAEAAGLAARRMTHVERIALREIHRESAPAVSAGETAGYIKFNTAFHEAIYAGARNVPLADLVSETRLRMRFFRHQSLSLPARLALSFGEHTRIVAAIEAGDEIEAQQAMRAHIIVGGSLFADMVASIEAE
ncbi:GntR family transcriptional regulator [Bradyrhizobium sp. GCM10027634]|uniref:GntR family transcriptional regulator n=1 Tax=unclassified Bradyrhizobium TaxID=2631580 RepID=UPI00188A2B78|nr:MULTISPECIES: GntR family transcriptional regulator [unclassified Bradyrhizobium]MDN5005562.1 GntR family transcriptional regulator [Bradyrhizobium sp. WYCCWR 12677]QOZ44645.1 GntR family transcriptional regulator [Bradyrhizobium sp. CCBAU 53340]